MKKFKNDNKGFSLVELLVVIAIMVVLIGVVAPTLLKNIERSRESKDVQTLDSIASAIQSALALEKAYDAANKNWTDAAGYEISKLLSPTTADAFTTEFNGSISLKTTPLENFSSKKAVATGNEVWFKIANGHVTVWIQNGTTVVDGESVKFEVVR